MGGFHTEYSGMRFAMYQLAEYSNIFSMCAICSSLFLGGWNGPTWDGTLPALISGVLPTFWLLVKTYVLFFILIWLRATLPRMRYDQLMQLGWKRLIPGALVWLIALDGRDRDPPVRPSLESSREPRRRWERR